MNKLFTYTLFLLFVNVVMYFMVDITMVDYHNTIDRIAPSTEELRFKYGQHGTTRLSESEVKQICDELRAELNELSPLKMTLFVTAILLMLVTITMAIKSTWKIARYDALHILLATCLLFGVYGIFDLFMHSFPGSHNATIDFRIVISIVLLIVQPILFYVAYRLNKIEISQGLHAQKWISYTSLVLAVLFGLLATIIGVGILFTPDLGGNIS